MGAAASEESGFTCGTSFDSLSLGHKLHRKNKSTPWQGCNLKGMPVCTILRGRIQMRDVICSPAHDYVILTIVMKLTAKQAISKSRFKSRALEYFRQVEQSRKPLIITDRGKPVLKVVPFSEGPEDILKELRNSVIKYKDPTESVGETDWEALR